MGLRTVEQFRDGLRDGRAVYVNGRRVDDVATDPILGGEFRHYSRVYEVAHDPQHREMFAVHDPESGEWVSRFYTAPRDIADLQKLGEAIRTAAYMGNGSEFSLIKFTGANALLAASITGEKIDRERGTSYGPRARKLLEDWKRRDVASALAMSDTKGDRSLGPSEQADPDLYLHVVERRDDGIVIRGAKTSISGAPYADELIVMPTKAMKEKDADYAVGCVVPTNAPGVKVICSHVPLALGSDFDAPMSGDHYPTHPTVIFDDVFVPWERVFLCGEYEYAIQMISLNSCFLRLNSAASKPAKADLLVGTAQLIAEVNGLEKVPLIKDKIAELMVYAETLRALGVSAIQQAEIVEGVAVPNSMVANVSKLISSRDYYHTILALQDIAGGGVVTSPMGGDLENPETREYVLKYFAGSKGIPTESRLRLFKLVRDLTASDYAGDVAIGNLHGEGSIGAQKATIQREYDIGRAKQMAARAAKLPVE
jgi:aromatic ring hydroxylase